MNIINNKAIFRKILNRRIPLHAQLDLTYRCNLVCRHCCVDIDTKRPELKFCEIRDIFFQLSDSGTLFLIFSGGEIFSRSDIFKILEQARLLNFVFDLFTNCTLISKDIAKRIKEIEPLSVETSLYGLNSFTHDQMTQINGSFEKTLAGIKNLLEYDIHVKVKTVVTKYNYKQIVYIRKMVEKIGAQFSSSLVIFPKFNGDKSPAKMRLTNDMLSQYFKDYYDVGKSEPVNIYGKSICNMARSTLCVTPYGDIHPCPMLPISLGNIRYEKFNTIWNPKKNKKIQHLIEIGAAEPYECGMCRFSNTCQKCFAFHYLENGSFDNPGKELCRLEKYSHTKKLSRRSHEK